VGFAPHRQAVRAVHTGSLEKWECQIISMMKLKLQYMTAENLSLARAEKTKWKPIGTFFNMLEKLATENNLSDTPGTC